MFLSRGANKNYSIIIIPERGSSTKTLKLSTGFLEFIIAVFFVFLFCIFLLIIYSFIQRSNISIIHKKDYYIQTLEKVNRNNLDKIDNYNKEIDNYNKNGSIINIKLKEIQHLEDIIKNKMNKSITFKNVNISRANFINININNEVLIKDMDNKIISLSEINIKMNEILNEEQYIPSILPCLGSISSYFGYRANPFNEIQSDFHPGIDIVCAHGTKIYAAASGIVNNASYNSGYGNEVVINHHNGIQTIYGHNSKLYVKVGQVIRKGELIALSGSSGRSTGPHLHFEIRKNKIAIDPKEFFFKGEE